MKTIHDKACRFCGAHFATTRKVKKFCKLECKAAYLQMIIKLGTREFDRGKRLT